MSSDFDLIARLLDGDAAAVREVRDWISRGIARFGTPIREEADDIEQEVLLDLMEALDAGKFRNQSRLETYVRSYVRFKCSDRLRAAGRREMVELDGDLFDPAAPTPHDDLTRRETAHLARQVLEAIPGPCRELWEMIADGLSYQEMSRRTGLREGALRVRVHRCRQKALDARSKIAPDREM